MRMRTALLSIVAVFAAVVLASGIFGYTIRDKLAIRGDLTTELWLVVDSVLADSDPDTLAINDSLWKALKSGDSVTCGLWVDLYSGSMFPCTLFAFGEGGGNPDTIIFAAAGSDFSTFEDWKSCTLLILAHGYHSTPPDVNNSIVIFGFPKVNFGTSYSPIDTGFIDYQVGWGDSAIYADTADYADTSGYAWMADTAQRADTLYGVDDSLAIMAESLFTAYSRHIAMGVDNLASGIYSTIGGGKDDTASGGYATIAGGVLNAADGLTATIGGGTGNTASGDYSTVGGGFDNDASGNYSAIGGGKQDTASGIYSTVGGGTYNVAGGIYSAIGGGFDNDASGSSATIGGGYQNIVSGLYSTVGGGKDNDASGFYATVGGGYQNIASGNYATVSGGYGNLAQAIYSYAQGLYAKALGDANDTCAMAFGTVVVDSAPYAIAFGDGPEDTSAMGHRLACLMDSGFYASGSPYAGYFEGNVGITGNLEAPYGDFNRITVRDSFKADSSLWWYCKYMDAINLSPGGSGATQTVPTANTIGGYQFNADTEYLYFNARVCNNWDGLTDLKVEVTWELYAASHGANDSVFLDLLCWYKGDAEDTTKYQALEVGTLVGNEVQYIQHISTFIIDYDLANNVVEIDDVFAFRLNLDTAKSDIDDIMINFGKFSYKTRVPHPTTY